MKKLMVLLLIMLILVVGCQGERAEVVTTIETTTETTNLLEERMVIKDGDVISGRTKWDEFFQETTKAKDQGDASMQRVIYIDEYWTDEYGKEAYYKMVLSYKDGKYIYENITEDRIYKFQYLIERSGQYKNAVSKNRIYYLVNDDTVTYDELQWSVLSSQSSDGIPHLMIFWETIE